MSDVMFYGVLRMPYELTMSSELSRRQFYDRVQEAANRIERLERELKQAKLQELADIGQEIERKLAERKPASIEESNKFHELLADYGRAVCLKTSAKKEKHALIAYIDGRTAGTAPEGYVLVPTKYTPAMRAAWDRAPQSDDDDCDFAGAYAAMIAAAPTPINNGMEEAK